MNCYIPSGHLLLPAKATGVDKLRPLHKDLGSGTERRSHDGDNDGPPRNYNDIRAGMVGVSEG